MCSLCRFPVAKTHNFGQILTFRGSHTDPFLPMRVKCGNVVCYSRPTVYAYVPNFVSIGLFCRPLAAKKKQFLTFFWTSAFSDVAIWQQSEKVEHGCTSTNLPLSNGIKIVSVLQRLHSEIWRTISEVQMRCEQTGRQTDKKLNVFGHGGG